LLSKAATWVATSLPANAFIIDYMCGTGFLLNEILSKRSDLSGIGCDISQTYVDYGRQKYRNITLVVDDARSYQPPRRPDLVICTAGIHHLPRDDQPQFVGKVSSELFSGGYFLLGEELIRPYANETARRQGVLELFSSLMGHLQLVEPPPAIVEAATLMFVNDWYERGEFKTSQSDLEQMLQPYFEVLSVDQIWPSGIPDFGDWLLVCQRQPASTFGSVGRL
jgi:hypothetical protein